MYNNLIIHPKNKEQEKIKNLENTVGAGKRYA